MVDDQLKEEITSYPSGGLEDVEEDQESFPRQQRQQNPQSSDMGEALEQVIRLAEDLQEGFLPESKRNRVWCDTPPRNVAASAAASPDEGHGGREVGLLSRLFKGNTMGNPRSRSEVHGGARGGTGNGGGGEEAPWREYAKDFQDV
jgi:hypothetical protein